MFNERRLSSDALIREACLGASDLGVSTPECAEKLADARAADTRADRIRDEIIAEMNSAAGGTEGAGAEGVSASAASLVDERIGRFAEKRAIEALARAEAASAVQTDEFAKVMGRMLRVLRRLGHVDDEQAVPILHDYHPHFQNLIKVRLRAGGPSQGPCGRGGRLHRRGAGRRADAWWRLQRAVTRRAHRAVLVPHCS